MPRSEGDEIILDPAVSERAFEPIFTWPFINLIVANGAIRIATTMMITLVPLYVLSRGRSEAVAGLTTTIFMLSAVIARPAAGRLVDTRGRYPAMVVGSLIFAAGAAMYVTTLPIALFLAVRVIQGIGFSLNGTAVMTVATDLIPESRMQEGIGYLGLEATLAQVLGPSLALFVMQGFGYNTAFAVVFGFTLLTVVLRLPLRTRLKRRDRERRERADAEGAATARGSDRPTVRPSLLNQVVDQDAWRPAMLLFCIMLGTVSVNTFLAAYILDKGIPQAGLFFAASGIMVAVARLLVGRLERRVGPAWMVGSGIALVTIALLVIFWSPNLAVLIGSGVLFGWAMGVIQPGVAAQAVLVARIDNRGMANSTVFLAMDLSQAIGAVALGAVAGVTGMGSVFVVSAIVTGGTLLVFAVAHQRVFAVG